MKCNDKQRKVIEKRREWSKRVLIESKKEEEYESEKERLKINDSQWNWGDNCKKTSGSQENDKYFKQV